VFSGRFIPKRQLTAYPFYTLGSIPFNVGLDMLAREKNPNIFIGIRTPVIQLCQQVRLVYLCWWLRSHWSIKWIN